MARSKNLFDAGRNKTILIFFFFFFFVLYSVKADLPPRLNFYQIARTNRVDSAFGKKKKKKKKVIKAAEEEEEAQKWTDLSINQEAVSPSFYLKMLVMFPEV